jgi:hypothetical protein
MFDLLEPYKQKLELQADPHGMGGMDMVRVVICKKINLLNLDQLMTTLHQKDL